MDEGERILQEVRKALSTELHADIASHPLTLSWENGDLAIEGKVDRHRSEEARARARVRRAEYSVALSIGCM